MGEPIRILHIVGAMYPGGVENFIMNLYRRIDRERFQFDFVVHSRRDNDYIPEIESLGGRVYELPRLVRHPVSNLRQIRTLVEENGYAAVERHTANALVAPQLLAAKSGGAVPVCHSHSSDDPQFLLHRAGRLLLPAAAGVRLACSEQAGHWMYGEKYRAGMLSFEEDSPAKAPGGGAALTEGAAESSGTEKRTGPKARHPRGRLQEKGTFRVIRNAVDIGRFSFSQEKRDRVRRELGLEGKHLYGNVGNYIEVKNHPYQLRIYREILRRDPDAVCLCIGEGEKRPQIEAQIQEMGLEGRVILTGLRSDVDACLSALDVLIFPSIFEGLPLSLIEAQAAGLPMLVSDVITPEAAVTEGLVEYRPIEEDPALWADRAVELAAQSRDRTCQRERIAAAGYDLETLIAWYERFYTECAAM